MSADLVLTIHRHRSWWTVAPGSEDAARRIGWHADGRFEAHGFPPVHASAFAPLAMRALTLGVTIRPVILEGPEG